MGQCLDEQFQNIWDKKNKSRQRLIDKVKQRGMKPTYENCMNYFTGQIKWVMNSKNGNGEHMNVNTKAYRRIVYGTTRSMADKYRKKNRKSNR
jgi:hypothetical protein